MAEAVVASPARNKWPSWLRPFGHFAALVPAMLLYASVIGIGPLMLLWLSLCLLVGGFVSTLVHEAGHALAARLVGWRVIVFAARPIAIQLPNRNIAWMIGSHEPGVGGFVAAIPRDLTECTPRALARIVAAGPAASIAFALLLFACWLPGHGDLSLSELGVDRLLLGLSWETQLRGYPPTGDTGIDRLILALACQSLATGLFTLLPNSIEDHRSDGGVLRALRRWRATEGSDVEWARAHVAGLIGTLLKHKVRLRDLPDWMLAQLSTQPGEAMRGYLLTVDIGRVLDTDPVDAVEARRLIEEYRVSYGETPWLACCDAWLGLMHEARAEVPLVSWIEDEGLRPLWFAVRAARAARAGDAASVDAALEDMRVALRQGSPFRDPTFRDIERQVRAIRPSAS